MQKVKRFFITIIILSGAVFVFTVVKLGCEIKTDSKIAYLHSLVTPDIISGLLSSDGVDESSGSLSSSSLITGEMYSDRYAYFSLLDGNEKEVYAAALSAARDCCDSFSSSYIIYEDDIDKIMTALFNDHPELFYLKTAYSYEVFANGRIGNVYLEYYDLLDNLDYHKALFDNAINSIVSEAAAYSTDYEKEKFVHDKILSTTDYNEDAEMNQSAYSALVNHSTVCTGYSKAFQMVMLNLGIPTYICIGDSEGVHAWNIIKLSDGYYNVDLTWDDQWTIIYNFFNCTDEDFSETHVRTGLSVNLPSCTATAYRGLEGIYGSTIYVPGTEQVLPVPEHDDRPVMDIPDDKQHFNDNAPDLHSQGGFSPDVGTGPSPNYGSQNGPPLVVFG